MDLHRLQRSSRCVTLDPAFRQSIKPMPDPADVNTGPVVGSQRKTGIWSLPPVVLATIVAVAIGIGYQLWQLTQPTFPLDLNSAVEKHLTTLQGIDEATAQRIIAGRPYKRKDELVRRQILEQEQYERIKEQIIARQK
jgi:hypothetical protein